jgi:hypothetical protein
MPSDLNSRITTPRSGILNEKPLSSKGYVPTIIHAETPGWYSLGLSYEARVAKREYWIFGLAM